jgi:hypothetical protein
VKWYGNDYEERNEVMIMQLLHKQKASRSTVKHGDTVEDKQYEAGLGVRLFT